MRVVNTFLSINTNSTNNIIELRVGIIKDQSHISPVYKASVSGSLSEGISDKGQVNLLFTAARSEQVRELQWDGVDEDEDSERLSSCRWLCQARDQTDHCTDQSPRVS